MFIIQSCKLHPLGSINGAKTRLFSMSSQFYYPLDNNSPQEESSRSNDNTHQDSQESNIPNDS